MANALFRGYAQQSLVKAYHIGDYSYFVHWLFFGQYTAFYPAVYNVTFDSHPTFFPSVQVGRIGVPFVGKQGDYRSGPHFTSRTGIRLKESASLCHINQLILVENSSFVGIEIVVIAVVLPYGIVATGVDALKSGRGHAEALKLVGWTEVQVAYTVSRIRCLRYGIGFSHNANIVKTSGCCNLSP